MINKIFFTLALILYTAKGFSQDYIEDFFSSSPEQIVTLTESRDFLIGGIIHPLSGQPCLRQLDLVAKGAQNLDLKRIFIPFHIPLNEHNGRINPSKSSYGGWVYFPHTHLNVFKKGKTKGKKNFVTETVVSVSDSQGAVFSYQIDKRGNTKLKTKPWGVCNGVDDQPSGIYDPRNTSISVEGKNVSLQAPDGTKRYYYCSDYYELTINKEAYVCNYCLLQKEVLPNGKVLRYQYNSERQVIKVESLDPTEAYVYATLEIDAPLKGIQATISTNTGLQASYGHDTGSYFKNDKNKRYIDLLYPLHFTNVDSPNFKNELLNYYKNSNGDSILTKYTGRHPIFKCKSRFFPSKNKNEKNPWVVVDLSLPSGAEAFSRVYSMQYVVGVPGETNSETTVTHSDGIKTIYTFNPQMLPEKVSEYDQQGSLVKEKTFKWMANQWLQSISISDEQQVLSEKKFQYDAFGNPISEILTGDLTGNSQTESYEIKRTFSTDRRNLLLSEEHSNGKVICYTYLPETNLLTSCLVKENGSRYLSREFRRYDSYNNLIQVVYDDGSAENVDDLTDVSERKIIHHLLRQQQPFLHMPEYIEVKYLENGCEKLLKRTHLVYDQWGNVSQEHVHDAEGKFVYTIYKEYDEQGNLLSETNPLGQKAYNTYDAYGRKKTATNFSNNLSTLNDYDAKGRLIRTQEMTADGKVRNYTFAHDHKDRLIKKTDSYNHSTSYSYDLVANQPIQVDKPNLFALDGKIITVTDKASYDALGRKRTFIDANGNQTHCLYNIYGSISEKIYPDQSKESFTYTKNGLLASHIFQNDLTVNYQYDVLGNVINKTYSINGEFLGKEVFEYKGNKLLKNYDLEGNFTQYAYDGLGRKISEAKCGCLTTYQYDNVGNIAVVCEENGDQSLYTHFTYDLLDQVLEKKKTDREGRLLSNISYTYDGNGNVQTIKRNINGQDAVDTFIYDSYDREICHQDPQGAVTTTHYDESVINIHGQQVLRKSTKNPQEISTEETFNPHGFLVKQEKLNGASQLISAKEFDYDACGNRLLNQDHVYQGTDYSTTKTVKSSYDFCNRIKSVTRAFGTPEACTTTFTYNQSGKLSSKTLPDGITLKYTYDGLDNLKSIKSSDGKLSHAFSYNRLGYLLNASDDLNGLKIVREVDFQGNILVEEFPNGIVIKKKYDHFHRPLSISLPDGSEVVYQYDPLFLKNVKRLSPSGERLYEHSYQTYDESGHLLSENLIANLGIVIHTTDTKGQSLSISNDYFKQECKYDSVGNLTNQFFTGTKKEFGYDDLSQLISEPDHDYVHDSLYNRIQENEKTFHYNALNEYLPNEDLSCTYDQRGNLIEKSISGQIQKYSYDPLNRLIEAVNGNNKICYNYDPFGRKIGKTVYELIENEYKKNFQEFFFYDGNNDIGAISDEGRVKQLRILGFGNHPEKKSTIAIELEGKTYAPYLDCQGNVRGLIDIASKVIAVSYDYSAFGKQSLTNNIFNPWQYASKRFDSDLGLIDFGKRFYDPLLGRWLAVDPAGFIDSHNLYQFNFNNPFRYTDPNGQWIFVLPFLCGGFGIGATGAAVVTIEIVVTDAIIFSLMTGLVTGLALSDGVGLVERAHRPYMNEGTVTEEDLDEKKKGGRQKIPDGLDYFPDRPMPKDEHGNHVPDADVPHTQLTTRKGKQGNYPQAREWGYNDQKVRDIDFTDHGKPLEHPDSPHQHRWEENSTGGSKTRSKVPEPVEHWKYL